MGRCPVLPLGVAAAVMTLGLSGCSSDAQHAPTESTPTTSHRAAAPRPAELPPPEVLVGVLQRLCDPEVAGAQKLAAVEGATAPDAETLDRFTNALRDNGYTPPFLEANGVVWSENSPANVDADVTVKKPDADAGITIPMEFKPYQHGWQLSEQTFDMLLNLGEAPAPPPPEPPR